jgi:hypothetical protein
MDPVCLLIEAVAVELCCLYIVSKWSQVTGGFATKAGASPKIIKRRPEGLVTLTVPAPMTRTPSTARSIARQAAN